MGARVAPGENGGFLQVSGLPSPSTPSTVVRDDKEILWRFRVRAWVKNVMIGGETI
jgi:hypothetical protein